MTSKATRGVYTDLLSLVLSCTQSDTTPQPIFTFNLTRIEVQFFEVTQTDYALNDEPLTATFLQHPCKKQGV